MEKIRIDRNAWLLGKMTTVIKRKMEDIERRMMGFFLLLLFIHWKMIHVVEWEWILVFSPVWVGMILASILSYARLRKKSHQ